MAYTPPTNGSYISGKLNSSRTNCRAHASSSEGYIRFVEPHGQTRRRPSESTPLWLYLIKVPRLYATLPGQSNETTCTLRYCASNAHRRCHIYPTQEKVPGCALDASIILCFSTTIAGRPKTPSSLLFEASHLVEPTRKFLNTSLAIALDENYYNYLEKKKKPS